MKTLIIAARWLFIACLPFLLLTASIGWAVNSAWLYKYGFDKYGVSQTTGLARSELEKAASGLIHYFNSDEDSIAIAATKNGETFKMFNAREVAHLRDVKGLVWLDYRIFLGTLAYALAYSGLNLWLWKDRRQPAMGVVRGSALALVLMLALGLGALLDFDRFFLQFHLISFANEFWILDPSRDYLIMLFPAGFWYDATLFCALATVAGAIVLGGAGAAYLMLNRSRTTT